MYVLVSSMGLILAIDRLVHGFDGFCDVIKRRVVDKIF